MIRVNMAEYLERKLRTMKPSEQRFINADREDKVFWRGEDIEFCKLVYEETQRMRSIGVKAYRTEAIGKFKRLVGVMT